MTPERLAELEKASKDNRLVILPRPIGTTVYAVWSRSINDWMDEFSVEESVISGFVLKGDKLSICYNDPVGPHQWIFRDSRYYDTKAEAKTERERLRKEYWERRNLK